MWTSGSPLLRFVLALTEQFCGADIPSPAVLLRMREGQIRCEDVAYHETTALVLTARHEQGPDATRSVASSEVPAREGEPIARLGMDDLDHALFAEGRKNVARLGDVVTTEVSADVPAAAEAQAKCREVRDDRLVIGEAAPAAPRPIARPDLHEQGFVVGLAVVPTALHPRACVGDRRGNEARLVTGTADGGSDERREWGGDASRHSIEWRSVQVICELHVAVGPSGVAEDDVRALYPTKPQQCRGHALDPSCGSMVARRPLPKGLVAHAGTSGSWAALAPALTAT